MPALGLYDQDYTSALQKALAIKTKTDLVIDGDFGPASFAALKQYQQSQNLAITGVYDQATKNAIEPYLLSKFITKPDIVAAAGELGLSAAFVKAVCTVESSGSGFLYTDRVKILFERHWMYNLLTKKYGSVRANQLYRSNPGLVNPTPGGYASGANSSQRTIAEWGRFSQAFAIDPDCAMQAASWGMFQCMGFNYAVCGFNDVGSFVDAMKQSEQEQLKAFVTFNKTYLGGKLWSAAKAQDFMKYAEYYNGPAQKAAYGTKLMNAYGQYAKTY